MPDPRLVAQVGTAQRTIGCLLRLGADGRAEARGTATLVQSGHDRLLLTARHVVEGLEGGHVVLELPPVGSRPQRTIPFTPVVEDASKEADAALLAAPQAAIDDPDVLWMRTDGAAQVIDTVRRDWRAAVERGEPHGLYVLGFPSFGAFDFTEERLQLIGAIPIPGIIVDLNPLAPVTHASGQMRLQLEDHIEPEVEKRLGRLERAAHARLRQEEKALGGYSGGPVIALTVRDPALIGIVSEGGQFSWEELCVYATPIDELIARLRLA